MFRLQVQLTYPMRIMKQFGSRSFQMELYLNYPNEHTKKKYRGMYIISYDRKSYNLEDMKVIAVHINKRIDMRF